MISARSVCVRKLYTSCSSCDPASSGSVDEIEADMMVFPEIRDWLGWLSEMDSWVRFSESQRSDRGVVSKC